MRQGRRSEQVPELVDVLRLQSLWSFVQPSSSWKSRNVFAIAWPVMFRVGMW
jgi:hypothetical protein